MTDSIESAFATDDECWMHDGYGHIQKYRVLAVSPTGRVAVRNGYRSARPRYTDDVAFKTFEEAKANLLRVREFEVSRRRNDLERAEKMRDEVLALEEPTKPDEQGRFRAKTRGR